MGARPSIDDHRGGKPNPNQPNQEAAELRNMVQAVSKLCMSHEGVINFFAQDWHGRRQSTGEVVESYHCE